MPQWAYSCLASLHSGLSNRIGFSCKPANMSMAYSCPAPRATAITNLIPTLCTEQCMDMIPTSKPPNNPTCPKVSTAESVLWSGFFSAGQACEMKEMEIGEEPSSILSSLAQEQSNESANSGWDYATGLLFVGLLMGGTIMGGCGCMYYHSKMAPNHKRFTQAIIKEDAAKVDRIESEVA